MKNCNIIVILTYIKKWLTYLILINFFYKFFPEYRIINYIVYVIIRNN